MRTIKFKIFLIIIAFSGIILCMSAAKNDNIFMSIVQSVSGGSIIYIAIELARVTKTIKDEKSN